MSDKPPGVRSPIACRWCGANPAKDPKIALGRVNEKGVPGIWECIPYCIPDRLNLPDEREAENRRKGK